MTSSLTIQQRVDDLFKSLDQGRRNRLTSLLTPLTCLFTEAGFAVKYAGIATNMGGHDLIARPFESSAKSLPRHERARYMGHVIDQARNAPIADRWTMAASPRYELVSLATETDRNLVATLGRDTMREAVFMHMHRGDATLDVTMSTTGPRQVATSYRALQGRWATKAPVDIVAEFLMSAKSPASGIVVDVISALAEKPQPAQAPAASPWSGPAYTARKREAAHTRMMNNQLTSGSPSSTHTLPRDEISSYPSPSFGGGGLYKS